MSEEIKEVYEYSPTSYSYDFGLAGSWEEAWDGINDGLENLAGQVGPLDGDYQEFKVTIKRLWVLQSDWDSFMAEMGREHGETEWYGGLFNTKEAAEKSIAAEAG